MPKYLDLTGRRFGKLVAVEKAPTPPHIKETSTCRSYWLCKCDCGGEKIILSQSLVHGRTRSCGCLSAEIIRPNELPREETALRNIIRNYKNGARLRGIEFALEKEEIKKLIQGNCVYCGSSPNNIYIFHGRNTETEPILYNGIDRVDNSVGYIFSNVVTCCGRCNKAKDVYSVPDFLEWIESVYNYRIKKGENNG